jgi:hypothetical protein
MEEEYEEEHENEKESQLDSMQMVPKHKRQAPQTPTTERRGCDSEHEERVQTCDPYEL